METINLNKVRLQLSQIRVDLMNIEFLGIMDPVEYDRLVLRERTLSNFLEDLDQLVKVVGEREAQEIF